VVGKISDRLVKSMPWLDGAAVRLQAIVAPIVGENAPRPLKDALVGTWLGHPLHPAVVQLPIGCWTSAAILDFLGKEDAADALIGIGVAGALGAAVTGAAQWVDATNDDAPRRLGTLHAIVNGTATLLYSASFAARRRGNRAQGITYSMLGLGVSAVGAQIGGDLSFDLGLGVDHDAFATPPSKWTDVLGNDELEDGKPRRVELDGASVLLLRHDDGLHAVSAVCPHLSGPLDEGTIDGETVTCPWHGSVFCLTDGKLLHGPATAPLTVYQTKVEKGRIKIRVVR
jgi:nitrite reductase/ring-hydroxylating ferredoxin subunit/uncharacterized membrane protein